MSWIIVDEEYPILDCMDGEVSGNYKFKSPTPTLAWRIEEKYNNGMPYIIKIMEFLYVKNFVKLKHAYDNEGHEIKNISIKNQNNQLVDVCNAFICMLVFKRIAYTNFNTPSPTSAWVAEDGEYPRLANIPTFEHEDLDIEFCNRCNFTGNVYMLKGDFVLFELDHAYSVRYELSDLTPEGYPEPPHGSYGLMCEGSSSTTFNPVSGNVSSEGILAPYHYQYMTYSYNNYIICSTSGIQDIGYYYRVDLHNYGYSAYDSYVDMVNPQTLSDLIATYWN